MPTGFAPPRFLASLAALALRPLLGGCVAAAAPLRVNGVAGDDERAIEEAVAWLATAPGVTGQLLALD